MVRWKEAVEILVEEYESEFSRGWLRRDLGSVPPGRLLRHLPEDQKSSNVDGISSEAHPTKGVTQRYINKC